MSCRPTSVISTAVPPRVARPRPRLLASRRIAPLVAGMLLAGAVCAEQQPPSGDLLARVDVMMRGGHSVFRGASVPYGMMKFGPPHDGKFTGFATSCLSGAHVARLGIDLEFLPGAGPLAEATPQNPLKPGVFGDLAAYRATPAWLQATGGSGVVVEASTTCRAALMVVRFPAGQEGWLLLPDEYARETPVIASRLVTGRGSWQYYALERDTDPLGSDRVAAVPLDREKRMPSVWRTRLRFAPGSEVRFRLGVSQVSRDGALANLRAEIPGWDLAAVRAAAEAAWRAHLDRFVIEGGSAEERRAFATFLFRAALHQNIASDVDGAYRGFDDLVRRQTDRPRYVAFSGWDVYRTWVPWTAVTDPARMAHMMQSMVDQTKEDGKLPRWTSQHGNHRIMEGQPAILSFATAHAFGVPGIPVRELLATEIVPAAEDIKRGWRGLAGYLQDGGGSASQSLEYHLADFAISRLAAAIDDQAVARRFHVRSGGWHRLYDPATGLLDTRRGFTEGNAHTYSWFVPFDQAGLFDRIGRDQVGPRLDAFFTRIDGEENPGEHCGLNNQPSYHTPWLYCWIGQPAKTQALVLRAVREVHVPGPKGDDDLGAASTWALWAMSGLYPVIPGVAGFVLHTPTFPRVVLPLGPGRMLEIRAPRPSAEAIFIQSVSVNGRAHPSCWLPWSALDRAQNTIEITLGAQPGTWSTQPGQTPPSFPPPR